MPSLVLATIGELPARPDEIDQDSLLRYINEHTEKVLILDGLQRTYTIIDAAKELRNKEDMSSYDEFCKQPILLELYTDINKFGVLYRMLTLNTGQTPMSARHQLEMLYSDLLNTSVDGLTLISDTDGKADPDDNEFVFQFAIEGFNSYMNRSVLPIDRQELLENIKMLEKMAEEDTSTDLFKSFLECYIKISNSFRAITKNEVVTDDDLAFYNITGSPFGKKASKIFSSSQALTGFGAAVGKLKDYEVISSFSDIERLLPELEKRNSGKEWMLELLSRLDNIRNSSKKIGTAQRSLFHFFFRELFNREGDSYLNLSDSVANGFDKYSIQIN